MTFKELGLSQEALKALDEFGITEPTSVQEDVIPAILEGRDIFTIAPSRCGKTMSYVMPLLDIISAKKAKNILIITPDSKSSVQTSDCLAVFNKYHEISGANLQENEEIISDETNVVIGAPDLLLDVAENDKIDFSKVDILVVDDINLIKKNKQLSNLEKVLALLPSEKQNIVYTNRRSKETQDILAQILKTPEEIKIDKNKEQEVEKSPKVEPQKKEPEHKSKSCITTLKDKEALDIVHRNNSFNGKAPEFLLIKAVIAEGEEK